MRYLLDTCVISELIRPQPVAKVVEWIKNQEENYLFISALTFGEIYKGIEKLPDSPKKAALVQWVDVDLKERFWKRIIDVDLRVAETWGKIQGKAELDGNPMPAIDALIAATGLTHDLIVVTRNTSDMERSEVALLNPWEEG